MRTTLRLSCAAIVAAALVAFITGCYYMPGSGGGIARVAVGVKAVPPSLVSAALIVTAPGMTTISASSTGAGGSLTVSVPAGSARTFTLLLNSASATLQGVATVDLQPGENTTITLSPTLSATQIVIPDFYNGQIVQISDMTGAGLTKISAGNLPGISTFSPYAVDFDNQGRIYIANNTVNTTEGLIRIDDINHPSSLTVVDGPYSAGINSLAIDRTNGLIYYTGTAATSDCPSLMSKNISNIAALPTQLSRSPLCP